MPISTLTGYEPFIIPGRSAVSKGYITPAATFTATTPTDGGSGKTILTSSGAHGLTSAVAVGKHLNITAGTGWAAGFYPITAIDLDTTGVAVTITAAFDAGMGSPTIALAGTEATFHTVTIPPLGVDSFIEIDASWSVPGSTNIKNPRVKLGGTIFYGPGINTASQIAVRPSSIVIQNRGATNSQINSMGLANVSQNGQTTVASTTGSIDTSVSTSLTIGGLSNTANEFVYLERFIVKVFK
jgi:hypothetical protein